MDLGHAACRRVRARRLIRQIWKSAEVVRTAARLQTRLAIMRCHREDVAPRMRLPSDSKSPPPVSRGGLQNSCDGELMPVICPTCQLPPSARSICASMYLFKALDGRRAIPDRGRFRRPGNRRRTYSGGSLLLNSALGRCCAPDSRSRRRPSYSPGMRDRGTRGISNDRSRHRTHGAQNNGARDSAHRSTTGSALGLCFDRKQRRRDRRRHQPYLHRDFPVSPRTALRKCGGTKVTTPAPGSGQALRDSKSPRPDFPARAYVFR